MESKEKILFDEENNDGQTIWLYYNEMIGLYVAYGLSAYYTTMVAEPYLSYSEELEMPVALLNRKHILIMRQSLRLVAHGENSYYRFETKSAIGDAGYNRWVQQMVNRFERTMR